MEGGAAMKKGTELKQHFHTCMPLFIALGDEYG